MFFIRLFTLIFCLLFTVVHAEQPIIKNTKREKAINAAVGNFYGCMAAYGIAALARIYSEESFKVAQQVPWWCSTQDLHNAWISAGIISYVAKGLAIFFAINGILFVAEAYTAQPTSQEQNSEPSSKPTTTEQSHE